MNYDNMSDFELNLLALRKFVDWDDVQTSPLSPEQTEVQWGDGYNWLRYDPCNNWISAGKLIDSYGIGIRKQSNGMWAVTQPNGQYPQYVKSVRRGIVIVALMIEEAKSEAE